MSAPTPTVTIDRSDAQPIEPDLANFHYVDQGNYLTLPLPGDNQPAFTMYSDSATSCIIVVVVGATHDGSIATTLAHLDSPERIEAFFTVVDRRYARVTQLVGQGANPPDNSTATQNAAALNSQVTQRGIDATLFLREGDPREQNLGDFGARVAADNVTVTNQPYTLSLTERDPTCGAQTAYCIMRRESDY